MAQKVLKREIIARSETDTWEDARAEWRLREIQISDEPETCLCGHHPIKEICVIRNKLNKNTAEVGNCCVNHFLGLASESLFTSIRNVRLNPAAALNVPILEWATKKKWLSNWELGFYYSTRRKRKLSEAQRAKRIEINETVLKHILDDRAFRQFKRAAKKNEAAFQASAVEAEEYRRYSENLLAKYSTYKQRSNRSGQIRG